MNDEIIKIYYVRVSIPRKMLNKSFDEHKIIDFKTYRKTRRKLVEIESAIHQLQNVQSVIETISNRFI
jgi:hypothetical protein